MTFDASRRRLLGVCGAAVGLAVAGCLADDDQGRANDRPLAATTAQQFSAPTCSCCSEYATYLQAHLETTLEETHTTDVAAIKRRLGVPDDLRSCHTVVIDDYVVEGHVPVASIRTLLDDAPAIDGISLPGMPTGSPGMGGTQRGPLRIYAFSDGRVGEVFAELS